MSIQKKYIDCDTVINTDNAYVVIASGDDLGYKAVGLTPRDCIKEDTIRRSGEWLDQTVKTNVLFKLDGTKISQYNALIIEVYSEKATGAGLTLCIYCQQNPADGRTAYKRYTTYVDWTGWKRIMIPLSEMSDAYSADLNQASRITWNASGWGNTPNADTVLCIDTVYFAKKEYRLNVEPNSITPDEYTSITNTLSELLVGNLSMDTAPDEIRAKLEEYTVQADEAANSVNDLGIWNYDMSTTAGITSQYGSILKLAKAYSIKGGKYYRDEAMLTRIKRAMSYMHENYYSDRANGNYPSRNNWWDWEIGSAQFIVNILMLCKDGFTQEEMDRYLEPVNRYVPLPSMTMANLVDMAYVTVSAAALQRDAVRIVLSRNKLDECMGQVIKGDGFYRDGSFIQHTIIPYTGSYGPIMLEALSKLILSLNGTCFRVKRELTDEQYCWATESFIPCMYHGVFYGNVRGRSLRRSPLDFSPETTAIQGLLRMTEYVSADRARLLKSVIKEYAEYNDSFYTSMLEPYDAALYREIKSDNGISARTDYETVKNFAMMDRPISVARNYAVTVSLSSSRTAKYEGMNEENGTGWYTGDGMTYIYTDINDYSHEYWNKVNSYRLPGTTVTTAPRTNENNASSDTLSKYDFVGSACLGSSMAIAMQLESATDKMKAPQKGTPFISDLTAKKAWFVFDGRIVCMGADIGCTDKYTTETVIDNRRLRKSEALYANGEAAPSMSGTIANCHSVWFSSLGGIYLPKATDVCFNRTDGDDSFVELYIDHGRNITNGEYSYVILPTATREEAEAYCASPDIEILSNTPSVQAVNDKTSGIAGYIFWEKGSVNGIEVSAPCVLLISNSKISVSDPTMKLNELTVTVNGKSFTCEPRDGQTCVFEIIE